MDYSAYTSNIQPNGLSGGTNIASNTAGKESTQQISQQRDARNESVNSLYSARPPNKGEPVMDEKQREQMVEKLNEFVEAMNTGLSFRIDEDTGRDVVTIYDLKTGDILRQFPSEDMLEIFKRLSEHSTGLISESV